MKDGWLETSSVYTFIAEIATGGSGDRQASSRAAWTRQLSILAGDEAQYRKWNLLSYD
jgi:hypothetical protein